MKKHVLLILLILSAGMYLNAQPVIEMTGKGIAGDATATLNFDDVASIEKVVIEAMAVFRDDKDPGSVVFSDADENYPADFILAEHDFAPFIPNGTDQHWGYYTATFNTVDVGGITIDKNGQNDEIVSLVAYVYRNNGSPDVYTEIIYEHAFIFRNGSGNPFVYEFNLAESSVSRDFQIKLPMSDMASGYTPRYAIVKLSAGTYNETFEYSENNMGDYLHIAELNLTDIPGDVTTVQVSIYSPTVDEKLGDSFITGSVLLTVTEENGCTLTQGYWKTHSEYGPAKKADPTWEIIGPDTEFFLSGDSYINVINTPPAGGNAYYILAQQYIAAELNFLSGANSSEVMDAFEDATDLFNAYTPSFIGSLNNSNSLVKEFKALAGLLDEYNKGLIGPGHCPEGNDEVLAIEAAASLEAKVNPNPVRNNATIKFVPVADGSATVELFDMMGNKKASLYQTDVLKDFPVELNFNAGIYDEGSYIVIITNGNSKESIKIRITK